MTWQPEGSAGGSSGYGILNAQLPGKQHEHSPGETTKPWALLAQPQSRSVQSAWEEQVTLRSGPAGGGTLIRPAVLRQRWTARWEGSDREGCRVTGRVKKVEKSHPTHRELSTGFAHESRFNSHQEVNLKGCINSLINVFLDVDQGAKFCTATDLTGESSQSSLVSH